MTFACGGGPSKSEPSEKIVQAEPVGDGSAMGLIAAYLPAQRTEVERYCSCSDAACKTDASGELRRLNQELVNRIATLPIDKDAKLDPTLRAKLISLSERVGECGIPASELAIETPKALEPLVKEREETYARRARENAARNSSDADQEDGLTYESAEKKCIGGNGSLCFELGKAIAEGRDGDSDPETAAELYRKGCDLKHLGSCDALSKAYATGRGVPRDATKAKHYKDEAIEIARGTGILGALQAQEDAKRKSDEKK